MTDQSNVGAAVLNQLKRLEGAILRKQDLDDDDEDDDFGNLPPKNLDDFFRWMTILRVDRYKRL